MAVTVDEEVDCNCCLVILASNEWAVASCDECAVVVAGETAVVVTGRVRTRRDAPETERSGLRSGLFGRDRVENRLSLIGNIYSRVVRAERSHHADLTIACTLFFSSFDLRSDKQRAAMTGKIWIWYILSSLTRSADFVTEKGICFCLWR
jgi:hypothetical protein